ncbi:MAG: ComF family protein [Magnetococcales bacterium]|nr:ComF family protein [Magnetococcales bacterium]MBF0149730.1 ComF family protein [Magnetococcales bacterium]
MKRLPTTFSRTLPQIKPALHGLLDLLFPTFCPACGIPVPHPQLFCFDCIRTLPPLPEHHCLYCGTTTSGPVLGCGSCLLVPNRPDRVCFPFTYTEPIARLIVQFKFSDRTEWAASLIDLAMERVGDLLIWEDLELVVPVPLHPLRLVWRGYNQAALLAGALARRLDRPLVTNGLYRIKMTRPQTRLRQKERLINVRNAFTTHNDVIANRTILLVDDVFTTGSTIWSATRALKKGGARRVVIFCLARVDH